MEETEGSDGFRRDDTDEFNEAWIHGRVITGMVQKTFVSFIYLSRAVYITQPYLKHPKIRKCLDNSAVSFI
ncbi:hypothetical protein Bca101_083345 [Brassica carinata]